MLKDAKNDKTSKLYATFRANMDEAKQAAVGQRQDMEAGKEFNQMSGRNMV